MRRITKLALAIALSLLATAHAYARTHIQGYVERGGGTALASASGNSLTVQRSYPGATVTVFVAGTATLASIYRTATTSTVISGSAVTANTNAYYEFWLPDGTYDFRFSGGTAPNTIPSPFTFTSIAVGSGNITVSVTSFGAACDGGVTDDSVAFQAAADFLSGPHRITLPVGICKTTTETLITQDRVSWIGQGKQVSKILFVPTVTGKAALHYDKVAATTIIQGSVRDLTIVSSDTTYQKFALRCTDCSEFDMENVAIGPGYGSGFSGGSAISPFVGGSSSGLYLEGRDFGSYRNVEIAADIPLRIGVNPNFPSIDIDHHAFTNMYLLPIGENPSVYIEPAVNLTQVTFDGYQAWVGGSRGLYWVDTTGATSFGLSIANVRGEQPTARQYFIEIDLGAGRLYGLTLDRLMWGSLTTSDGIKLRSVSEATLDTVRYNGTGVALDVDNSVLGIEGRSVFFQASSTTSITGQILIWATGDGANPTGFASFRYDVTNSTLAAGKFSQRGPLLVYPETGNLASGATVTIPSQGGGAANLLGRVVVVAQGATKHVSCAVSFDNVGAKVESTTASADCDVGNIGGKLCVHWSSINSIVLRNNLGEDIKYWFEVTQVP